MAAPVMFTEEHSPRDSKASPGGEQSHDTAELCLSAPASSQAPSWGAGGGISHSTYSTGDFSVQIRIILSGFALFFSNTSFPIFSGQTTDIWKILHVNFSSKGKTNSSMILDWVISTSRG